MSRLRDFLQIMENPSFSPVAEKERTDWSQIINAHILALNIVKQRVMVLACGFEGARSLTHRTEATLIFSANTVADGFGRPVTRLLDTAAQNFLGRFDVIHLGGDFTLSLRQQRQAVRSIAEQCSHARRKRLSTCGPSFFNFATQLVALSVEREVSLMQPKLFYDQAVIFLAGFGQARDAEFFSIFLL
ncbi:hypothetical protein RN69_25210 [Bradyrhizobium japonicum]|nr:hypothetical protein RN69_25210 [Bradyrhizobium japonicum]